MVNPQHRRARSLDRQFPPCLGKMVNLFDLSSGLSSNKLLIDRPRLSSGPALSRSFSDMSMAPTSPSKHQLGDRRTVSHMRRSSSGQKSSGTPMKALIEEEMSKDVETKHVQPNVIAKLMGLEVLPPKQQPCLSAQKGQSSAAEFWDKDCLFLDKEVQNELAKFQDYKGCSNFYENEMMQQHNNLKTVIEQSPHKGRQSRNKHEKKIDLVRKKFADAKRLVMDEKLRHSKEFQDALEVLSSNRELFLSFLQEPDSLFPGNLCELQSLPREAKRITILRPSKMVDVDKLMKHPPLAFEPDRLEVDDVECVSEHKNENYEDCHPQPTRIVVLKPGTRKNDEMKTSSFPCSKDSKCYEKLQSNDVTGEIPCPIQENLTVVRRDETLLSSVCSNGYTGDDSSFYKTESEALGNLSDSEVTSTPRHSWDFVNQVGSPRSLSSGRVSYSPESSVCREAKKRLSERWALMASHQKSQESRHVRTDSGTLGEMLALMDTKKSVRPEEGARVKEEKLIGSASWLVSDSNAEGALVESPNRLVRSKSVPVSSSSYTDTLVGKEAGTRTVKPEASKEVAKKDSVSSSFKGKVSSLFSFRGRKSNKEKSCKSQPKDKSQSTVVDTPGDSPDEQMKNGDDNSEIVHDNFLGSCFSPSHDQFHPEDAEAQLHRSSVIHEVGLSVMPDSKGNQDHPSPISVLDPSFEEDDNLTSESSAGEKGHALPPRFNLIDKSPPIGSIARTLSWDDSIYEASAPYLSKSPNVSPVMEEGLDWLAFVQTLLSEAGFDGQLSLHSFISSWYSSESPLDPSLRKKFASGATMSQAKCRQRSAEQKLAFDSVNSALIKVTGYCGSSWSLIDRPYVEIPNGCEPLTLSMIVDHVWTQMKEWFSDEVRCVYKDDGDSSSLVVEKVVRNEVVGKGWVEKLGQEMDCLGKDIELKLLGELVDEAVRDLTGRL